MTIAFGNEKITDIYKVKFNINKTKEFLGGQMGIGQVAIHNTNHVLAQDAGLKMIDKYNAFNVAINDIVDLGLITNEEGLLISDLINELISLYVDVAKDPAIIKMNGVQDTINLILMLIRQGVPIDNVFLFFNQPIIKDFLRINGNRRSASNNSGTIERFEDSVNKALALNGIYRSYDNMNIPDDLNSLKPSEIKFNRENLINNLKNSNDNFNFNVLKTFIILRNQSMIFQKMIASSSPDTKYFKSFSVLESQLKLREEVKNTGMFINFDNLFSSFTGEFWNSKQNFMNVIFDKLLIQKPTYKKKIDYLKNTLLEANKYQTSDFKEKLIQQIDNDFVVYLYQIHSGLSSDITDKLFKGKRTIPKVIRFLQNHWANEGFEINYFLESISVNISDEPDGVDNIKPKFKNNINKDKIVEGFKQLDTYSKYIEEITGYENFYDDLITFAILQSGLNNSPFNIRQFVDEIDYFERMKEPLLKAISDNTDIDYFTDVQRGTFVLNNLDLLYRKTRNTNIPELKDISINYNKTTKRYKVTVKDGNDYYEFKQQGLKHRRLDLFPKRGVKVLRNINNLENC